MFPHNVSRQRASTAWSKKQLSCVSSSLSSTLHQDYAIAIKWFLIETLESYAFLTCNMLFTFPLIFPEEKIMFGGASLIIAIPEKHRVRQK